MEDLELLRDWLQACGVDEVVMESTGQYHKPVWLQLEGQFRLHLAQAQSNRGPKGRKRDFADALRLVKRFLSEDLILSYVPDPEQRLWRRLTRTKTSLGDQRKRPLPVEWAPAQRQARQRGRNGGGDDDGHHHLKP